MASLTGKSLSKTFGSGDTIATALEQVSIELQRGEIDLVMGPSGSGKSTLMAVLSGLMRPDGGQVVALGHDLWRLPDGDRKLFRLRYCGFVFQGYNLFPSLTARQQLEIVLRWGEGVVGREAVRRADAMLDLLGLSRQRHRLPQQLSGGEKQRVAVGRALVKRPAFLFADEPTSALDWPNGRQVIELLRRAAREHNAAVMVIAHDARVLPHVDRVHYLEDGAWAALPQADPVHSAHAFAEVTHGSGI
jgi:putative ABC transport system ATP-binding protein